MRPLHLTRVLNEEVEGTLKGHHTPVMLWGPPGVGKSQIVMQIGERHDLPVIDIRLSQMEPSDLRGIPFKQDGRVEWAVPSILPDAGRHGEQGILFLDKDFQLEHLWHNLTK
jgi:MoxR-like ATPase